MVAAPHRRWQIIPRRRARSAKLPPSAKRSVWRRDEDDDVPCFEEHRHV